MAHEWKGIYAVLVTPFHQDLSLDLESLERQVDFCHECGVHGLVAPVNASEYYTLSDDERRRLFETVATANAGRVPFVAGVSGVSGPHSASLAKHAAKVGANAVMAMPTGGPHGRQPLSVIIHYYRSIAEASGLPLMLQNAPEPIGSSLTIDEVRQIVEAVPAIEVVKEETAPNPQKVGRQVTVSAGNVSAVFGGHGGIYLFNELARGANGTMPACEFLDVVIKLYNLYTKGAIDAAREVFNALLPALVMERLYGHALMKVVLKRRGVIASTVTRTPSAGLDEVDLIELDKIMQGLAEHTKQNEFQYSGA